MFDFVSVLFQMVNMPAAMIGVAAAQVWNFFVPSQDGPFATSGGGWRSRVAPVIAPVVACAATLIMEWDAIVVATDVSRGILSGFASEYALRIYYKTIKGL